MNFKSVTGKNWIVKNYDNNVVNFYKDNFFLDEVTSRLLAVRNINKEDVQLFLNPSIKNLLPDPYNLKDMSKGVLRTIKSIENNEKLSIFGDYDVDGASSTALLGNYFKIIGMKFEIYIPDRKNEGYGPSINSFDKLISSGSKLIFTVDCGTLSFKPIDHANSKSVDVIVLDHHQSEVKLPNANSLINPNRLDDESNLNYLCAAGVTFMFLVALNSKLREMDWFKKNNINEPNLINFLDLVSLGTICDVVPLIGLNRAIVKQGLKIIKRRGNIGLKTLIELCNIESNLTTKDLGYAIGPRINAGGRVGKCSHGANLLLNIDPKESFKIASELNQYNKDRQELEKKLLNIVLNSNKEVFEDPVLIISGENWHEGVIGIVASRIKDKFNKPTIIISTDKNIGKASARSVQGFDIGSAIIAAMQKNLLLKGGGHKMAAGFSIDMNNLKAFKKFIISKFKSSKVNLSNSLNIFLDSELSPAALNLDFYEKINNLAPFGSGNPEPKFFLENMKVINSKVLNDSHIKSTLIGRDGTAIKTIAFNAFGSELSQYLNTKNKNSFNIAGKLSLNVWQGKRNVEFIIDDISVIKNHKN